MELILVSKDSCQQRMRLQNVATWFHSHGTFTVCFEDGHYRSYPDIHIWYVESAGQLTGRGKIGDQPSIK